MLTSFHNGSFVQTNKEHRAICEFTWKPGCIVDYNKYMELTDMSDMQSFNECNRKTVKWYKKLTFHIFDLLLYNAYILFREVKNNNTSRFCIFQKNVLYQIFEEYKFNRKRRSKTSKNIDIARFRKTPLSINNDFRKRKKGAKTLFCSFENI